MFGGFQKIRSPKGMVGCRLAVPYRKQRLTVEAQKLEHHYPHALKVK